MPVNIQNADLSKYCRIIAVSDLHGDLDGFMGLLATLSFSDNDALVIVGDIIEKGPKSLPLLRHIMKLHQNGNVYVTMGNNDVLFSEWYLEDVPCENILRYIRAVPNTTIGEMATELNMPLETCEDLAILKSRIMDTYPEELHFLLSLPDILETECATFVHAGLQPGPLDRQDRDFCLATPSFDNQKHAFEKPLIVGHWPCSNYCTKIIDASVRINFETNVISLDGGNSMKPWQQINYLILKEGCLKTGYFDKLPKIVALDDQSEEPLPVTVIFPDTNLEILERGSSKSLCSFPAIEATRWVDNDTIYEYKHKLYCPDFTTYRFKVQAGECLTYCGPGSDGILVKRNGIVGIYSGEYKFT